MASSDRTTNSAPVAIAQSLCVVVAGLGQPLAVDDVATDPVVEGHSVRNAWASWASVPVYVNGVPAGAMCALEKSKPRRWTLDDQAVLEEHAREVTREIEGWLRS